MYHTTTINITHRDILYYYKHYNTYVYTMYVYTYVCINIVNMPMYLHWWTSYSSLSTGKCSTPQYTSYWHDTGWPSWITPAQYVSVWHGGQHKVCTNMHQWSHMYVCMYVCRGCLYMRIESHYMMWNYSKASKIATKHVTKGVLRHTVMRHEAMLYVWMSWSVSSVWT